MRQPSSPLALVLLLLSLAPGLAPAAASDPCRAPPANATTLVVAKSGGRYAEIQPALNDAKPGQIVLVKAGTYRGDLTFPRSGSAGAGCIFLLGERGVIVSGGSSGLTIKDQSYIAVDGLNIRDINRGDVPNGITITGNSSHLRISRNVVEKVEGRVKDSDGHRQAHGIVVTGTAGTPMTDILIDANEIRDCLLGQSESLTVNGNVDGFSITNNKIHDNNNIGIDMAGHWGVGPAGQDFVRNGLCRGNEVANITSGNNPDYNRPCADGIYVDGGALITIENNRVSNSDIGIEAASENAGQAAKDVTIQNNSVAGSLIANVRLGGEKPTENGGAQRIFVLGNSLTSGAGAQVLLLNNCKGVEIDRNTFRTTPGKPDVSFDKDGEGNVGILVNGQVFQLKEAQ